MKTIRRRAVSPVLTWASAGPNQEYRVIVRNQDTGERRAVYEGFRTECRLPPDMRLTSDQLAFRVMARPGDDPDGRFERVQEYHPIPRLGDDYETPADDLLVSEATRGAGAYRLWVRSLESGRVVVDMTRPEPRFLLPAGRLRDGTFRYEMMARVGGRWRKQGGRPVTREMLVAADARADRLVQPPRSETPEIKGEPATHAPGRADRLAPEARPMGPRLLVAVDATAAPALSPIADPRDVAARQWWAGDGSGAVESVALTLEANGLKGLFLLDVLAGEALGDEAVAALASALSRRGHGLGLMVNPEPWRALSPTLAGMDEAAAVDAAVRRYEAVVGGSPLVASFGEKQLTTTTLTAARRAGVRVVLADRNDQIGLPAWMRWRTTPFAAFDDLLVVPSTMVLSTPAHGRDRVVRHRLSAADPMAAAAAETIVQALVRSGGETLVAARIDPLALLLRTMVRSADRADAWNEALAERLTAWGGAGWERSPHGFPVLADRDEIKLEMMTAMVAGLGRSGVTGADPKTVFSPGALAAWAGDAEAFEPLVEQRRGPRRLRRSAVRRYDAAFRQALSLEPA